MVKKKSLTVDIIKKERKPSKDVIKRVQEYTKIKRAILNALKDKPKTVPEISRETGLSTYDVMFYLMTLRRYGEVVETEETTPEGYYKYKLIKK